MNHELAIIQRIRQLPKEIANKVLLYLLGINRYLLEDIQHFGKCKQAMQIHSVIYYSDEILSEIAKFPANWINIYKKYKRKMVGLIEYDIRVEKGGYTSKIKIGKCGLEEYVWNVPSEDDHVDSRGDQYSILSDKYNSYIMAHYRVLYNMLSQLDKRDRQYIMNYIGDMRCVNKSEWSLERLYIIKSNCPRECYMRCVCK